MGREHARVLVDASNLHVGGGVQVAASIIDEMARMDGPRWLPLATFEVSSEVAADLDERTLATLNVAVGDTRPLTPRRWRPRAHAYDVSFTVFGPEYGWRRGRRRVMGFADVRSIYPALQHPVSGARDRAFYAVRRAAARRSVTTADRLVVETPAIADRLAELALFPRERIAVVSNSYNAVFDEPQRWEDVALAPPSPPGEKRLGYVSRAYAHKNHAVLPRIAQAARDLGLPLSFVVTLTPDEWKALPALQGCSTNLGPVSITQAPRIYQQVDAAIFPSLLEAFSATPVEAMRMGCLLFASDRDFVRSVCRDAPAYIDPLDADRAARTIVETLRDPDLTAKHVARGGEVVATLPTAAERAARVVQILDEETCCGS